MVSLSSNPSKKLVSLLSFMFHFLSTRNVFLLRRGCFGGLSLYGFFHRFLGGRQDGHQYHFEGSGSEEHWLGRTGAGKVHYALTCDSRDLADIGHVQLKVKLPNEILSLKD